MEELALASDNVFSMDRRGYVYATSNPEFAAGIDDYIRHYSQVGVGDLRIYRGANDNGTLSCSRPAYGF